jgi:hypothetical protein
MIIKVKLSLNIGLANASQEDEHEVEVDDNWNGLTEDEREEFLNEYWKDWSSNYIDGYCAVIE